MPKLSRKQIEIAQVEQNDHNNNENENGNVEVMEPADFQGEQTQHQNQNHQNSNPWNNNNNTNSHMNNNNINESQTFESKSTDHVPKWTKIPYSSVMPAIQQTMRQKRRPNRKRKNITSSASESDAWLELAMGMEPSSEMVHKKTRSEETGEDGVESLENNSSSSIVIEECDIDPVAEQQIAQNLAPGEREFHELYSRLEWFNVHGVDIQTASEYLLGFRTASDMLQQDSGQKEQNQQSAPIQLSYQNIEINFSNAYAQLLSSCNDLKQYRRFEKHMPQPDQDDGARYGMSKSITYKVAAERIVRALRCARKIVTQAYIVRNEISGTFGSQAPRAGALPPILSKDEGILADEQKPKKTNATTLIDKMLEIISEKRLVRRGTQFLIEKTSVDGFGTNFFEPYMTIEDFVYNCLDKNDHKNYWEILWNERAMVPHITSYLTRVKDPLIREYNPTWGVISFKRHIYCCANDFWWEHSDPDKPSEWMAQQYIDQELDTRFIRESVTELRYLPNYATERIDLYHKNHSVFENQTNHLNPILKLFQDQDYKLFEIEAACAILGRFFHPLGTDGFEIAPYFKGVAGSGKSSLCKLIQSFFVHDDVHVVSSKTEELFGLENMIGKHLTVVPEVTRKFNMDVADILTIISQDFTNIRRKHKASTYEVLNLYMMFAGNEYPELWIDQQGNLLRRIFTLDFPKQPPVADPGFKSRILNSAGTSIRMFNCAYLKLINTIDPQSGLIPYIPERFNRNKRELLAQSSPVVAFLIDCHDNIDWNKNNFVSLDDFKKAYNEWCDKVNIRNRGVFHGDSWKNSLRQMQLEEKQEKPSKSGGSSLPKGKYIFGMSFIKSDENNANFSNSQEAF